MRMRSLSHTFRSIKLPKPKNQQQHPSTPKSKPKWKPESSDSESSKWCVYLILSTNAPIKTYVGVTTTFSRRLKQHNGELRGGAKATRAGRPWVCACLIHGFHSRSQACQLELQWKSMSRKLPRRKKNEVCSDPSHLLLQHRQAALSRVQDSFDWSHLTIEWKLS